MPRRQEAPPLVCVEPAQLPNEGVLAARVLSPVLPSADQADAQSVTSHATREAQLNNSCRRSYVHVMVVNISQEEIVLTKATVLGVAEAISPCVVAEINYSDSLRSPPYFVNGNVRTKRDANTESKYTEYLEGVLGHFTGKETAVLKPVLRKYRHVFHDDETAEFQGTDLVEYRIINGDTRPIRKAQYRVSYGLREEMEGQVRTMLKKGVIEQSSSPWNSPAILVPKKSTDSRRKYRFYVDYRALNKVTQFDTCPLPIFEETVSTLHDSQYCSVLDCYNGF